MTQREEWMVYLPNGNPIPATKSDTSQSAVAKAMMMDIPAGCVVRRIDGEEQPR